MSGVGNDDINALMCVMSAWCLGSLVSIKCFSSDRTLYFTLVNKIDVLEETDVIMTGVRVTRRSDIGVTSKMNNLSQILYATVSGRVKIYSETSM